MAGQLLRDLAPHHVLDPLPRAQVELPQLFEQELTLGPELVSLYIRVIVVLLSIKGLSSK